MAVNKKDIYSGLGFFQAIVPQLYTTWNIVGKAIDTRGYEGCVFVVNVGAVGSAGNLGATSFLQIQIEHALASTYDTAASASAGTWSEVYPSQMIHSVLGMAGAYSTLDSGIYQSIASSTDGLTVYACGYKGPRRFVRVNVSGEDGPSDVELGAIAIVGLPDSWPVNAAVGD
jgi:hypothetical protein